MAGDATGLAAITRLLAHPEVTGVQVLREKPVVVGLRRGLPPDAWWSWHFGSSAAVALQRAERALAGLPLLAEETLP